MQVKIQSLHFDADQKLINFTEEKINKLDTFYDGIISGDVTFKLDKSSATENKVVEIRLQVPGNSDIFAKKQCKTFEEAVDESVAALKKQVQRHKEKLKGL